MGIDQDESRRQRGVDRASKPMRHPFVALEHRVIDSPAYASLSFSARDLLVLMGRQLTKDNNGHLQATFSWCERYGFGSEHTLRDAIADLISRGFIYRTRSHGANGAWARYALTWLPIKKREGLFLDGFVPFAWKAWAPDQPARKKSSRQKVLEHSGRNCSFTPELPAESAGKPTAKTAEYESCCHGSNWMPGYIAKLDQVGLAGRQCFQIPQGRTLQ